MMCNFLLKDKKHLCLAIGENCTKEDRITNFYEMFILREGAEIWAYCSIFDLPQLSEHFQLHFNAQLLSRLDILSRKFPGRG